MKKVFTLISLICLVCGTISLKAQIPNGGFENWVVDGNNDNNPVGWFTTNSDPDVSVTPYTPAYAGLFSMKVSTFDPGFMEIAGIAEISFPYNQRPSEITVCLKTSVMPGDKVYIIVSLFQGDSILASPGDCSFVIDSSINDFACLTFPIAYQSSLIPDSANIMIVAGSNAAQSGTEIIVDELSFGFSSGVSQAASTIKNIISSFPNPANNYTYIPVEVSVTSDVEISVYDLKGAFIQTFVFQSLNAGSHNCMINTDQMSPGLYTFTVKNHGVIQHGRFSVSR